MTIKIYFLLLVFSMTVFSIGCNDTIAEPCEKLKEGLIMLDEEQTLPILNQMLDEYDPSPGASDLIGHEANLAAFVEKLESDCGIDALLECYGCVETFPVISHVRMSLDSSGVLVDRTIDIRTPSDGKLLATGIHGN
jgi:hypothetical protein